MVTDRNLSTRLEQTEGTASLRFVQARARLEPALGARYLQLAGAYAMFDGPDSPITQTFGIGLTEPATAEVLDTLDAFLRQGGATPMHEVSPLADKQTLSLLSLRYRPIEYTNVMYLPTDRLPALDPNPAIEVSTITPAEASLWALTAANGWSEHPEFAGVIQSLGLVTAHTENAHCFLARIDGQPAATGALAIHNGVALLSGASTIPSARRQGAQRALLHARMQFARALGCDLIMLCGEPGAGTQRNAERLGFQVGYTRIKWAAPAP